MLVFRFYLLCLFLLFPTLSFGQDYVVVKRDAVLFTSETGSDRLTTYVKNGFMALEVIERKSKRIHVIARNKSYNPCVEGLSLQGIELNFWIEDSAPVEVLNQYRKWKFADGSIVELAAGTPITKSGAGELVVPVDKKEKSLSYQRSFVPSNINFQSNSYCNAAHCRDTFTSKKGLRYNGENYLKRNSFFGDSIRQSQCMSVQGKLIGAVKRSKNRGGGGGIGAGNIPRGTLLPQTSLFTKENKPIGIVLRQRTGDRWSVKGDLSCMLKPRWASAEISLCARTKDIEWGTKWISKKENFARGVVKKSTKFYSSSTSLKPTVHLKNAKGYVTVLLIERTKDKAKIRLKNRDRYSTSKDCYQNFAFPMNLQLEFWVDATALLDVTATPLSWRLPDGSEVNIAAGHVVNGTQVELESGSLTLLVDPKERVNLLLKNRMHLLKELIGERLTKSSVLPKKKKVEKKSVQTKKSNKKNADLTTLLGKLSTQGNNGLSDLFKLSPEIKLSDSHNPWGTSVFKKESTQGRKPRIQSRTVFFTSKSGIKYGDNFYKFPPMPIYKRGAFKEVGNRCWSIRGKLREWKQNTAQETEKYAPNLKWNTRLPIVGSPLLSPSSGDMGSVINGLPKWVISNRKKTLVCEGVEILKGQKKILVCLQAQYLEKSKHKRSGLRKKKTKISIKVKVTTQTCNAAKLRSKLKKSKKLMGAIRRQRGRAPMEMLRVELKFNASGTLSSLISLNSTFVDGERYLTDALKGSQLVQKKQCSAIVELAFKSKTSK